MTALRPFLLACFACLLYAGPARATTWDEPWHREVVAQATSFGLYEVEQSAPDSVVLKRIKHIAGTDPGATVRLESFYALRLGSLSADHGPEFRFKPGSRAYFHLKQAGDAWAIATPTAGHAGVGSDGKVYATYRISVHQALVDPALYEDTQRCIFEVLHGAKACDPKIAAFVSAELDRPVGSIVGGESAQGRAGFFRQHVALETAAFTHQAIPADTLERFLAKPDPHVQMSALRALAAGPRADKAERLMRFVEDEQATDPARAMAAILLKEIGAREMKQRLLDYAPRAGEGEAGLGIALMDPRIGTRFPQTPKEAVTMAGEQL